jgi:hypothetical protein
MQCHKPKIKRWKNQTEYVTKWKRSLKPTQKKIIGQRDNHALTPSLAQDLWIFFN